MAIRFATETTTYQEFQLAVRTVSEGLFAVRVVTSPLGESGEFQFTAPFSHSAIEEALASISYMGQEYIKRSTGNSNYDPMSNLGRQLFAGLMESTPIGEQWRAAQELSDRRHAGVRLRLLLPDIEAVNVPWEFLFGGIFGSIQSNWLALSTKTPIVRQRDKLALTLPPVEPPLRVLVVAANRMSRSSEEIGMLSQIADSSGLLALTVVTDPTKKELKERLANHPIHILHLIGAGAWSTGRNRWETSNRPLDNRALAVAQIEHGLLLFGDRPANPQEGATGAQVLALQELQALLPLAPDLRLVILSANDSDLAAAELARHAPAVLGVRNKISDQAVMALLQGIYGSLVAGQPLESAITQGRQMVDSYNPGTREWGLPVFYLNLADGRVLQPGIENSAASGQPMALTLPPTNQELATAEERDRQRLQSLIAIEEQRLTTLAEQRLALGALTPPHIEEELQTTEQRLTDLKRQLPPA